MLDSFVDFFRLGCLWMGKSDTSYQISFLVEHFNHRLEEFGVLRISRVMFVSSSMKSRVSM